MRGRDRAPSPQRRLQRLARRAARRVAQVNEALLGTEPDHDLSRLIDGTRRGRPARSIRNEEQLKDLITNFNRTMAAFAARAGNLQRDDPRCSRRRSRTPTPRSPSLNARLPADARLRARDPARRARDAGDDRRVVPVDRAGAQAARPQPSSRGLVDDLAPATRDLAHARPTRRSTLLPADRPRRAAASRDVILPTGDIVIQDGTFDDRRRENYKEFWYDDGRRSRARARTSTATARTCASRPAAASQAVATRHRRDAPTPAQLFGHALAAPTRHAARRTPGKRPPYKPDVACYKSTIPDLNGSRGGQAGPPDERRRHEDARSSKHLRDFVAIIVLILIALRRRRLHPVQPAPRPARPGCRSSARTSSTSRPSSRPPRRSRRARARRSNIAGVAGRRDHERRAGGRPRAS